MRHSRKHSLIRKQKKLRNPMWYATMCEDAGTVLEQCNIVRALHRLPVWEKQPEK